MSDAVTISVTREVALGVVNKLDVSKRNALAQELSRFTEGQKIYHVDTVRNGDRRPRELHDGR